MAHLICYDIADNYLRAKLSHKIMAFGLDRINKSVYLGTVKEKDLDELQKWLRAEMKKKQQPDDSLIIIKVGAAQVQDMEIIGRNDLDKDELTGDKHTLIV